MALSLRPSGRHHGCLLAAIFQYQLRLPGWARHQGADLAEPTGTAFTCKTRSKLFWRNAENGVYVTELSAQLAHNQIGDVAQRTWGGAEAHLSRQCSPTHAPASADRYTFVEGTQTWGTLLIAVFA